MVHRTYVSRTNRRHEEQRVPFGEAGQAVPVFPRRSMAESVGRKIGEEAVELRPLDVRPVLEVDEEGEENGIKLRTTNTDISLSAKDTAPLIGADSVRVIEVEHRQPATIPVGGGEAFVKCRMLRIRLMDVFQILAQVGYLERNRVNSR